MPGVACSYALSRDSGCLPSPALLLAPCFLEEAFGGNSTRCSLGHLSLDLALSYLHTKPIRFRMSCPILLLIPFHLLQLPAPPILSMSNYVPSPKADTLRLPLQTDLLFFHNNPRLQQSCACIRTFNLQIDLSCGSTRFFVP